MLLPLLPFLLLVGVGRGAAQTTIMTTYRYNAAGALTAATTQVDDQAPTTTYFTWDNFVPSAADPTSGTVNAGDGNLLGLGPAPGSGFTTQYGFDVRDRLTSVATATTSATYTYDPASMLATATSAGGESLQFFYGNGTEPRVVNIVQQSRLLTSSYMEDLRSLSDGGQQVLLSPRKDVAGFFDPAAQQYTPYAYDPYGAQATAAPSDDYDLGENPFQYAGEFRDPLWGGYYLRARWYAPEWQTFLSRDPERNLNRYGYTDGNPIARVDPSGRNYRSFARGINRFLDDLGVGPGVSGDSAGAVFSRLFLGFLIGPLQILGDPDAYWHAIEHNTGGMDIFLVAGVASEVLLEFPAFDAGVPTSGQAFTYRLLVDAELGGAQSIGSGFQHGFHRFDTRAFVNALEYTVGGIAEGRLLVGVGYRPYNLRADQIEDIADREFANGNTAAVFRVKIPLGQAVVDGEDYKFSRFFLNNSSPSGEALGLGWYHEAVIAVTADGAWRWTENVSEVRPEWEWYGNPLKTDLEGKWRDIVTNNRMAFQFVGSTSEPLSSFVPRFEADPLGINSGNSYNLLYRNCHNHASAVIRGLNLTP